MATFAQRDATDCGAACLAYILHRFGLTATIAAIRRVAGTSAHGTSVLGLADTAKHFGLTAKGVRCSPERLPEVITPAIAHLVIGEARQHYVVICRAGRKRLRIMDPVTGTRVTWSRAKFLKEWTGVLLLLAPGTEFRPGTLTRSPLARVFDLLLPQRAMLLQAFIGAVLATLFSLSSSIYVQQIVDHVIVDGNRHLLSLLGLSMLALLVCRLVLGWFQSRLVMRTAQRIDATLILGYYRHLLRLPQPFFDTMRIGEITSRVSDAARIRSFLNGTFLNLLLQPLILVCAFAAMLLYSWRLALLSLVLLPINALVYAASDWLNRKYQRMIMERGADFDAQLVESLNAQPLVRACGLEEEMSRRTEAKLVRLLRPVWRAANSGLVVGTLATFFTQAYAITLLWVGASQVLQAQLTPGELMSSYALAGYLVGPITSLVGMNAAIREVMIATDRLYEIMDQELEEDQGQLTLTAANAGGITFRNVSFRYPGRLTLFTDLSFTLRAGEISAIVGASGSGKSTVLALIHRLHNPSRGEITIGEFDVRNFTLASLRGAVAVVPQSVLMLSGTLLENLAPGTHAPDMERLAGAIVAAGLRGLVESLPDGLRSRISENGENLSGGQRQRVALARALYAEAPIILLDEPSAALDEEAETQLCRLLQTLRSEGRTVVIATHSRRLLASADRIIDLPAAARQEEPGTASRQVIPAGKPVSWQSA